MFSHGAKRLKVLQQAATSLPQMDSNTVRSLYENGRHAPNILPKSWAQSRYRAVAKADPTIILSPTNREPERHPRTTELFGLPEGFGSPWAGRALYYEIPATVPAAFISHVDNILTSVLEDKGFQKIDIVRNTCIDTTIPHNEIHTIAEAIARLRASHKRRGTLRIDDLDKLYNKWLFNRNQPNPDPNQYMLGVSVSHQWKQRMSCQRAWQSCTDPMPAKPYGDSWAWPRVQKSVAAGGEDNTLIVYLLNRKDPYAIAPQGRTRLIPYLEKDAPEKIIWLPDSSYASARVAPRFMEYAAASLCNELNQAEPIQLICRSFTRHPESFVDREGELPEYMRV